MNWRLPPCYVTNAPLIVFYHFGKQLGFKKHMSFNFWFLSYFIVEKNTKDGWAAWNKGARFDHSYIEIFLITWTTKNIEDN